MKEKSWRRKEGDYNGEGKMGERERRGLGKEITRIGWRIVVIEGNGRRGGGDRIG